jgi:WD40 repeat protein
MTLATVDSSEVIIWDVQTGTQKQKLETEPLSWAAAFSPDGRYLAISSGLDVLLWDQVAGRVTHKVSIGQSQAPVAFSTDATILATPGPDNTILLWAVP